MRRGRGGAGCGVLAAVALGGCALRAPSPVVYDEAFFARKPIATYTIRTPRAGEPGDTVVGEVRTVEVRDGDTLLDLARLHDVGMDEMTAANPGVDPWVPPVGTRVVVPSAFVLPCCTYDGLVINIPEMRLFYYRPGPGAGTTTVQTFPVGLGRGDARTPLGRFRIAGKTEDPTWGVPERIRQEHIRDRGDARRFIPGGHPDNPLGRYRLELDRTLYRIHGTNKPWGIGRQVSHGCTQLFPEDIAHLFALVPVGTPVAFVYQPIKVGRRGGQAWVEVHADIYGRQRARSAWSAALAALRAQGLDADPARLRAALDAGGGVPRAVGTTSRRADTGDGTPQT